MSRKNNCSYQVFTSDFLKVQEIEFHGVTLTKDKAINLAQKNPLTYWNFLTKISNTHSRKRSWIDHLNLLVYNVAHSILDN